MARHFVDHWSRLRRILWKCLWLKDSTQVAERSILPSRPGLFRFYHPNLGQRTTSIFQASLDGIRAIRRLGFYGSRCHGWSIVWNLHTARR